MVRRVINQPRNTVIISKLIFSVNIMNIIITIFSDVGTSYLIKLKLYRYAILCTNKNFVLNFN